MAESLAEAMQNAGIANSAETGGGVQQSGIGGGGSNVNVGEIERWASTIGGGALAVYGITRLVQGNWLGAVLGLVGGSLIYRGTTGHCQMYESLGISTAEGTQNPNVSVPAHRGIKVEKSVTVNKSPEELYRFWRNFENLPRFMDHLESVHVEGDGGRSHWVAKAPAGTTVEWDAEIYNEKENELIAWRSLEGADVDNAGSVRFEPAPEGRGTTVRVSLKYDPPGGVIGSTFAKLFGEEPSQQIEEDLRRFKQVMEAGETPTTEGQPSGRSASA
ncbi:MAG TPA: SRPBCC family protein [Pyrinomonadaceae bacterium]|jgi:uncharacterized membrane protein